MKERIIRRSKEDIKKLKGKTDHVYVGNTSDKEIECQVSKDPASYIPTNEELDDFTLAKESKSHIVPNIDIKTLAVCIQALEDAIRYYDLLSQSETTNSDDYEECRYMFEVELSRICEIYKQEEENGLAPVPLDKLLKNV